MTALYIIAGIAAIAVLLLISRIRITVAVSKSPEAAGECKVFLGIGPVKVKLYPPKKEKIKLSDFSAKKYRRLLEADSASSAAEKPKEEQKKKSKKELLPGVLGEVFELVIEIIERLNGHPRCEILRLRINVASKDAATTALTYSGVSSATMFLLETIDNYTEMRLCSPKDVSVTADFDNSDFSCDIGIRFSIRTVNIIRAFGGFIKNYFRSLIKLDKQNLNNE